MDAWYDAVDAWKKINDEHGTDLTVDQQIAQANTLALIAIGQELSVIHHQGINPKYSSS